MRKGMLEYCILLLLHKEPSYASDIIQKLKRSPAHCSRKGYSFIRCLPGGNGSPALTANGQSPTQGPPRKYYSLTPQG